jgi:hypothetical protein
MTNGVKASQEGCSKWRDYVKTATMMLACLLAANGAAHAEEPVKSGFI